MTKNAILLFVLLCLTCFHTLSGQTRRVVPLNVDYGYDENIFLISDFSGLYADSPEILSLDELLERNVDGLIFETRLDLRNNILVVNKKGVNTLSVSDAFNKIRSYLDQDTSKIFSLFLDYDSDFQRLDALLESSGLKQYLYEYIKGTDWPSVSQMINSGKRLVVFGLNKRDDYPTWANNLNDYAKWQVNPYMDISPVINEIQEEEDSKTLFVFNSYSEIEKRWNQESSVNNIRLPFFIEPFKEAWIRNGMIPNFIVLENWNFRVNEFLATVREFSLIKGSVAYNNELLDDLYWLGLNSFTYGDFCFPLMTGERLVLTPTVPGYKITPESVIVEDGTSLNPNFRAVPLNINDNLELFLRLDDNADNWDPKIYKGDYENVTFVNDPSRGKVASFEDNSIIILPTSKDLNLTNHDFTISVWVKISRFTPGKSDYCIIGSAVPDSYAYLQEIHLLIRNRIPYFGFFANDITGKTVIEAGRWYNITCRYNSANGEQAIFVNGKLDSRSYNRPSYKGTDSLFVGVFGPRSDTYMHGDLDNLSIWSRALGDKEILGLSNGLISLDVSRQTYDIKSIFYVIGISLLIIALVFLIIYRKKVFSGYKRKVSSITGDNQVHIKHKNYIRFFGDFLVVDRNGNDITSKFSPKVKQLFMAILVNSGHENSGITSSDLTRKLWGHDLSKNLDNVRGVTTRKLRGILEDLDKVEIVFHNDRWFVKLYEPVYCDYSECLDIIQSGKAYDKRNFNKFLQIVQEGELFKNESFEWLDTTKGFVSNSIVDVLSRYLDENEAERELTIKIADIILTNDPVNDLAMAYKIKGMVDMNNRKLARYNFEQFCLLYNKMYGEKYPKSFEQFIADPPDSNRS